MNVFGAFFVTETNAFSAVPTSMANFEEYGILGPDVPLDPRRRLEAGLIEWRDFVRERGGAFHLGMRAFCQPSAPVNTQTYETLRDRLLEDLNATLPVDIVLLGLHGAMAAHGDDDCEGDILARVRALVGPDVVVGAALDPHAHLTDAMVDHADLLVFFKEYPHSDFQARYGDVVRLSWAAAQGEVKLHMATWDCRLIQIWPTQEHPIRQFVDDLMALEGSNGVLSTSFIQGFPWGDVPDLGSKILVVTDDQPEMGATLAEELGRRVWDMRSHDCWSHVSVDEALVRARAVSEGPLVLAETSDNPGGGAPQDSTWLMRALFEGGIEGAVVACVWDPVAVQMCFQAGEGSRLDLRIGGKMGPASGDPLDLSVTVEALERSATIRPFASDSEWPLGNVARVSSQGIDVILCSVRNQTFSPDPIRTLGIDPTTRKAIAIKSTNHFYAGFAPIAEEILYVETPGALDPDFSRIPYQKVTRPIWPRVKEPFAV